MKLTPLGPGDLYCQDLYHAERELCYPSCPTCGESWDDCPGGDEEQRCVNVCPICGRTVDPGTMLENVCTDEPRMCSACWSEVLAECAEDAVEEEVAG